MSSDLPIKTVSTVVAITSDIIKLAKDSPEAKAAGTDAAASLAIVSKAVKNVLLPIAAINFGIEAAETYFKGRFASRLAEKTAEIPPENLVEPKASIAGPTIQALAWSCEEPNLEELYLALLASAMDDRKNAPHPSFVEVLRQLDANETTFLSVLLKSDGFLALVTLELYQHGGSSYLGVNMPFWAGKNFPNPPANPDYSTYIENWARLGLIRINTSRPVQGDESYDWVKTYPPYMSAVSKAEAEGAEVKIQKGFAQRTSFGAAFADAVGITSTT